MNSHEIVIVADRNTRIATISIDGNTTILNASDLHNIYDQADQALYELEALDDA